VLEGRPAVGQCWLGRDVEQCWLGRDVGPGWAVLAGTRRWAWLGSVGWDATLGLVEQCWLGRDVGPGWAVLAGTQGALYVGAGCAGWERVNKACRSRYVYPRRELVSSGVVTVTELSLCNPTVSNLRVVDWELSIPPAIARYNIHYSGDFE